jgi:hypothetical protein
MDTLGSKDPQAAESVDLAPVAAALGIALTALVASWATVKSTWTQWFVGEIGKTLHAGDKAGLARLGLPSLDNARRMVTRALSAFAATSATLAAAELVAQDATGVTPQTPSDAELEVEATIAVTLLATSLGQSAGSEAARVHGPNSSVPQTQQLVHEHVANLTDAQLNYVLGAALHGAGNHARMLTLLGVDDVFVYASEVLDTNTCEPCDEIHGTLLGNTVDGDFSRVYEDYPVRGYIDCLGRDRCRGTVVGVYRKAAA